jgi:Tfp pilus assembly protein PilX
MILPIITMLLVVISWLGWQAIYSGVLNYQTVAISQRMAQQFFLAEHALSRAERWLQNTPVKQLPPAVSECLKNPCILIGQSADYFPQQPAQWWQATNNVAVTPINMYLPGEHQAFYLIEHLTDANTRTEIFYRITTWALLTGETMPTVLQSVWKKSSHPALPVVEKRNSWRRW